MWECTNASVQKAIGARLGGRGGLGGWAHLFLVLLQSHIPDGYVLFGVIDLIDYSVVADREPPSIALAEFVACGRMGIVSQ